MNKLSFNVYSDVENMIVKVVCTEGEGALVTYTTNFNSFKVNHPKMETLTIKDNTILEVRLDNNPELETVYGRFPNASLVKLSNKLVTHTLAQNGLIPWGCKLQLYN